MTAPRATTFDRAKLDTPGIAGSGTGPLGKGPSIKGWCPGALRPMRSGDGLVVRVRLAPGQLTPGLARAIAGLADRYGNGQIDLSQRANLQIRGVGDASWPALITALGTLGVLDGTAEIEAVRNVIVTPLDATVTGSGIDANALAAALTARIGTDAAFQALPGKFGFVVDDGGALPLDGVDTDIRFVGIEGRIGVEIGERWRIGVVDAEAVPDIAARLVRAFVKLRDDTAEPARRLRDLIRRIGADGVAAAAGLAGSPAWQRGARPDPGVVGRRAGFLGVGVTFGRLTAGQLTLLADVAEAAGSAQLALTPWRAILVTGADETSLSRLTAGGFITDAADPRLSVAVCPGAPECESAAGPVRADALALAPFAAALPGHGVKLHVSACAKGCARPQATAVTLIARENGYDLVRNGRASDDPVSTGLLRQAIESVLQTLNPLRPAITPLRERASYIRDGAEIYRHSFAIIRAEADLARFSAAEEPVAVRIIHACGMVEVAADIAFSIGAADAARAALKAGAPIFADAEMVARGVTRARLPANNDVICTLTDPRVPGLAAAMGTTRSAAAMELWRDRLGGSVVAIGNAPTSLFRLLEMLDEGASPPACVIGMPVGFVGAAESKDALIADGRVPCIIVRGRKGGSAMAAASINALASERE